MSKRFLQVEDPRKGDGKYRLHDFLIRCTFRFMVLKSWEWMLEKIIAPLNLLLRNKFLIFSRLPGRLNHFHGLNPIAPAQIMKCFISISQTEMWMSIFLWKIMPLGLFTNQLPTSYSLSRCRFRKTPQDRQG